jgi:thymidylate kinase
MILVIQLKYLNSIKLITNQIRRILKMVKKGKFVVVDGLDGVGKGVFLDTFVEEARKKGKRVYDVHEFWKEHDFHPPSEEIIGNYDLVLTSEPTFVGIGRYIREELTAKNNRRYTPEAVANAYALDRMILYQQLIIPLLEAGIDIYQSRSFSTSIVYQRQSALDEGREFDVGEILAIPGNAFCYQIPINFLIIPTIHDPAEAVRRANAREKEDNCRFENLGFQLRIKEHYESPEFREVFERKGTEVIYLDAGISLEESKRQARETYGKNLS